MNQIDLTGKAAIVTGAARGIGLAIVRRMLASGARCSMWDVDAATLETATKSLGPSERVHTAVMKDGNKRDGCVAS